MELLILLYLLALTGYVLYLHFKAVPNIKHDAEVKAYEIKEDMLTAFNEATSSILDGITLCQKTTCEKIAAIGDVGHDTRSILHTVNQNEDTLRELHRIVEESSGKAEETAVDILSGIERNHQCTSQIQKQLEENALAGAATMDKFNSGIANIFSYDPYAALRKGRETTTE